MTIKDLFKIIFDTEIEDVADYEELYSPFWNKELTAEDIDGMSKRVRDYKEEKMIQIIKRGTRKTCTCKECGCLFSYEAEDVKIGGTGYHGGDYSYIKCPQCNVEIYLSEEK